MKVRLFRRHFNKIFFSIEELFDTIQNELSKQIEINNVYLPWQSSGLKNRILNIFFSKKHLGEVNHITGDVHYLGIVMPKKNTILTIHDCGELENKKGIKKLILWFFWFYVPVKRLHYITTISQATKDHLLKYVKTDEKKIVIIPNCLIGDYKVVPNIFKKEKPVILQIGTTKNKNIERVAAALAGISCSLRIIGTPSENQINVLKHYGIDFFYESGLSREEIVKAYVMCDMVIFVSLIEGFGLPIIEAQATGRPVVTSNISAMPETAGDGACLVDPYNIKDIRKGVLKVINDTDYRNSLINHGIKNVNRFLPEVIAAYYLTLYKRVVSSV